jgi:hypothetical protein
LAIIAVCIAISAGWKLFLEDYEFVSSTHESLVGVREEQSNGVEGYSDADPSPEVGCPPLSSQLANPHVSEAHKASPNPRLSTERFNAALAAGLIDPPKIDFTNPLVETLTAKRQPVILLSDPIPATQNGAGCVESGVPLVAVASATLPASATDQTKASAAASLVGQTMDKFVDASSKQSDERKPNGRIATSPQTSENHRGSPRDKQFSARFLVRAAVNSSGNSSKLRSVSRNSASSTGVEVESAIDQSGDDHSQSPVLSKDLQRFASDFVRTNEVGDVAEQHRFFADSVHFYGEGDLSLASVEAATRRQHRNQQTKRSEITGPAVATGPVNGGFFVIEQPVRWTQLQGSKVTKGRSVLQLRVVPISHGNWKITSIDEVKKQ